MGKKERIAILRERAATAKGIADNTDVPGKKRKFRLYEKHLRDKADKLERDK